MLISLGIPCLASLDLFPIVTGQFDLQFIYDLAGDGLFYGKQVRRCAHIVLTPYLCAGASIDKIYLNVEFISDLFYGAHQYGTDIQLTADRLRVDVSALVTKCGC